VKDAKLLVDMACRNFDGNMHRNKLLSMEGIKGVIGFERFLEITQRLERDGVLDPSHANRPRHVNRVFFNRLSLLDNLYGTAEATAVFEPALLLEPTEVVAALPEAAEISESEHTDPVTSEPDPPLVQSAPIAQSVEQPKPVIKPLRRKPSNQTPAHP
jgi:hypothetical protein